MINIPKMMGIGKGISGPKRGVILGSDMLDFRGVVFSFTSQPSKNIEPFYLVGGFNPVEKH